MIYFFFTYNRCDVKFSPLYVTLFKKFIGYQFSNLEIKQKLEKCL